MDFWKIVTFERSKQGTHRREYDEAKSVHFALQRKLVRFARAG